jgi:DNA-binding NarL/FixJ family response regulator
MKMNEGADTNRNSRPLSLWLADDDDLLRELIAELVGRNDKIQRARQFSSAEEVLSALTVARALPDEQPPDVILLDLNMTGMSGIEAIPRIKRLAGKTRVFIMTTFYDSVAAARALKAGASGFVLKREDWDEIFERMLDESADWAIEVRTAVALPSKRPAAEVWSPAFRPSLAEA